MRISWCFSMNTLRENANFFEKARTWVFSVDTVRLLSPVQTMRSSWFVVFHRNLWEIAFWLTISTNECDCGTNHLCWPRYHCITLSLEVSNYTHGINVKYGGYVWQISYIQYVNLHANFTRIKWNNKNRVTDPQPSNKRNWEVCFMCFVPSATSYTYFLLPHYVWSKSFCLLHFLKM
jgi:hypothetical protein